MAGFLFRRLRKTLSVVGKELCAKVEGEPSVAHCASFFWLEPIQIRAQHKQSGEYRGREIEGEFECECEEEEVASWRRRRKWE